MSKLSSQVLGPPESECTWITEQFSQNQNQRNLTLEANILVARKKMAPVVMRWSMFLTFSLDNDSSTPQTCLCPLVEFICLVLLGNVGLKRHSIFQHLLCFLLSSKDAVESCVHLPDWRIRRGKKHLYYCRDHHTDLASILDKETQTWAGLEARKAETDFVWLGLRYTCTLEFWFWVEDHLLDFTHWAQANPVEECDMSVAMDTKEENHWFSKNDTDKLNFICKNYCMNCIKSFWDERQSICYLCSVDEHKGHDTVSAAAERTERQRELEVSRQNIQQRIQDREKDVKELQQEVEAINRSADKAVEDSKKIFSQLIRLIQKRSSDVKQQLRSQQETEVSRVKELQEKLEQEITELKRKDADLKQLSHTEDHTQFLHNYPSLSALSQSTDSSSIKIRPLRYFEDVTAAVSEVRDKLQDVLTEKWTNISLTVTEVDVLLPQPEPKTRAEFFRYSRELTLDLNTGADLQFEDGWSQHGANMVLKCDS
ncbi:hypothetical protein L3Q82_006061 [Scortum barcoo]|uniref:Uncharacterized protein n=1 Tax=Scortum barcoo TaxID=214431 RepID=A0ACB8X2L5_9TELE|nr:hypothetical protein L3Q82_006061 [Scortum barcoo]